MKRIIFLFAFSVAILMSCSKDNETHRSILGSWDYLDKYFYESDSLILYPKDEMWLNFSKDGYMETRGPLLLSVPGPKYSIEENRIKVSERLDKNKYYYIDIQLLTADSLTLEEQDSFYGKIRTRYSRRR